MMAQNNDTMKAELLAPAGSPEALDAAIGEGADAVYLGLKNFNARLRSANFAYSQFEGCLKALHRMGRKIYVTVNTVFEQREADRLYQLLKYLNSLGPDGILVQDFGVIAMVRDNFPALKLHASTQMNIASARGVNLLSRYGFSRAVLARELSLDEIRGIRSNTNMELEIFVHGALCMSVSGLCLFSSYLGGKSANRGMCTQACRRFYRKDGENGQASSGGPGSEGYFFSPADLELIGHIPSLVDAGVNSFKIEGRMKSAEYVGAVVSAYRLVLDSIGSGREEEAIKEARGILQNDFARAKTAYLIGGLENRSNGTDSDSIAANFFDWLNPDQSGGTGIPLGRLLKTKGEGETNWGLIAAGPLLPQAGDSVRLHKADDSGRASHKVQDVESEGAEGCWITIPEGFGAGDSVYLIQTKAMNRRYTPVIPHNLDNFKRSPGRDTAPLPQLRPFKNPGRANRGKARPDFPEGLYVQVSRLEDLYIVQANRPVKAMVNYHHRLLSRLLGNQKQPLPFVPKDIIIVLDPFFPQAKEAELAEDVAALMNKGYCCFVANNPGHFSLFRESGAALISGPWLYVFNQWAYGFINSNGADYFISPLENNRQNLERTFPREGSSPGRRALAFITVYSKPSLFRIRADLGSAYKSGKSWGKSLGKFSGGQDESFVLDTQPEGSLVFPQKPFYIADKIPFLREAGFSRFILDLGGGISSNSLKKNEYKDLVNTVANAVPLKGSGRFNWKDGFFRVEESPRTGGNS
ncbi:peptidase U32 family protein [Leadbettera azotonutricia]|uniref:Peptidase, U32 family n=1 Tax=Leadbettera azotonutricia (strain ATCC BAA-888 / DSM 13862 / ZAS-9) TaxID=545695 RepID=F5Y8L4_LEAAZ|nr:peptidase U32 family protein [Leadbettera azotonutricia]AEF81705.1 peptidase, U32 family [Leadbettera azotonutricia ZAS-9]